MALTRVKTDNIDTAINPTVNSISVSNTSTFTGAVTFSNTISVTNTATFSNTTTHTGAATFSNTTTHTGAATFSNTVTFTGAISANGAAGTAGQILTSNGTGQYWSSTYGGTITSSQITTGLGFTPYNATNPSGYLSSISTLTANAATYLSSTQQVNAILGAYSNMAMSSDSGATKGTFIARASGTGDSGLAGMSFWNDAYAIKMGVRNDGVFGIGGWSRNAWSWYTDASGNMVAAGNVTAYSDPKLKENFERVENPIDILEKLDGGTFNWKSGIPHIECKATRRDYGILADQVEAVMPEIVTDSIEIEGERYKTVAYEKLVPVLIEAIKELSARVKELESK